MDALPLLTMLQRHVMYHQRAMYYHQRHQTIETYHRARSHMPAAQIFCHRSRRADLTALSRRLVFVKAISLRRDE